jgi:hypothetical protein
MVAIWFFFFFSTLLTLKIKLLPCAHSTTFLTFHLKEKLFIFIFFTTWKNRKKKIITNYLFLIMLTRNYKITEIRDCIVCNWSLVHKLFFTYIFTENYESKHIHVRVRELAHKLFKGRRWHNFCHPTIYGSFLEGYIHNIMSQPCRN